MLANLDVGNNNAASKNTSADAKGGKKRDKFKIGNMKSKQKYLESRAASKTENDPQNLINEEFKDMDAPNKVVEMGDAKSSEKKKFDRPLVKKPIIRAPQDEPAPEAKQA